MVPERTPRRPTSEWELGFEAGKRHIVDILKQELKIKEQEYDTK
jgi:hypothetical protein